MAEAIPGALQELMQHASAPAFDVVLKPHYENGNATSMGVHLGFTPRPHVNATQGLLLSAYEAVNTPALRIARGTLRAWDSRGDIALSQQEQQLAPGISGSRWAASRETEGRVELSYTALPRLVDHSTRNGPALDFRLESGGLFASTIALLMAPTDLGGNYKTRLSWDLSEAPAGTKAVWTFGEAPRAVSREMTAIEILYSFVAAGKLQAYRDEADTADQARFNVYWFGSPPFAVEQLSDKLAKQFDIMSSFFEDNDDVYRIFIRHNPHRGTNTGTALDRSFMFGYDDTEYDNPSPLLEKLIVLSHEMVHNWITFDVSVDITVENWYPEGMAEYYALVILHKLNVMPDAEFVQQVNNRLAAYYTSPYVRAPLSEVAKHTWETSSAQRLPYRRGFAFALLIDRLIHAATGSSASLDDIVLALVRRNRASLPTGPEQFVDALGRAIGDAELAGELHANMTAGASLLVPPLDSLRRGRFALPVTLRRRGCEGFELGFDESAARDEHVVRRLRPGTRAFEAGLRDGDRLAQGFSTTEAEAIFSSTMKVGLQHAHETEWHVAEFWPRTWEKRECWNFEYDEPEMEL